MQQHTVKLFPKTAGITLLRFLSPEGNLIGEREIDLSEVDRFATDVERKYRVVSIDSAALISLGRELYEWLDGPAHRCLSRAMKDSNGMTLRIDVEGRLRHLPWELLHAGGAWLCFNAQQPFTPARLVTGRRRGIELHNRPLRLLFMACSAENVHPLLDFEGEERMILQAAQRYQIELFVEESGSLDGLRYQVEAFGPGHFDAFHLTGHADVHGDQPCFLMEDNRGFRQEVSAEEIAEAFQGNWPRLIFLSGCKTGQAPDQGHLPSLCEALVHAGAPAVLGWALPVGDSAASLAAAELYLHLAAGKPIDEAVAKARLHLIKEQSVFWHLLRFYSNETPLDGMVTPPKTPNRERLQIRDAANEFLDAGSKIEVCRRENFVGRRRPIQRCLRVLQSKEEDANYAEGILLHGMGGLGKSSLAARICERLPGSKRLVFVGALGNADLDFTGTISYALDDPKAIEILNQPGLSLTQRLRNLFRGPLVTRPVIFVFDDFEQNLEESGAGYIVKPVALEILRSLLTAIRETSSESRVIVTSRYTFPLPSPLRLWEEGLETLRDGELAKKLSHLKMLEPGSTAENEIREQAISLGAGNPRLLEWLNKVLADGSINAAFILDAMEHEADQFREDVLLRDLLAQLPWECRKLIALGSIYELPFDEEALTAVVDGPINPHLRRAVSLGLIEGGTTLATGQSRYFVSRVLLPLLEPETTHEEKTEAASRATRHRYQSFWQSSGARLPEMMEIFRLAMMAGEDEILMNTGDLLASGLILCSRYREAAWICRTALDVAPDYRLLFHLARTQMRLGETSEAIQHYEQALSLCPDSDPRYRSGILLNLATIIAQRGDFNRALDLRQQSLQLYEEIGDVDGMASALHEMALVAAQQGDFAKADHLWQQALPLCKQAGNVMGNATILSSRADVAAQRGDVEGAFDLWREALSLFEQIGDEQRQASTLHNMGVVVARQGDIESASRLWQQSLRIKDRIGDVHGKAASLAQMADLIGKQGNIQCSLELSAQAIQLLEQVGDVRGKAATLAQRAWLFGRQGDFEEQRRLNLEAAKMLACNRAWIDLISVIGNLGISPLDGASGFLAQAVWLTIHVEFPVEEALELINQMLMKLGGENDSAPLIAAGALYIARVRGQHHPKYEQLIRYGISRLAVCAEARKIGPDQFEQWVVGEGLDDPARVLPQLLSRLESMVGEEEWLYDRRLVGLH
jgi:tetratricopeptide (TPR) repeat protein